MLNAASIRDALQKKFRFKKTGGRWLQQGECPDCGKWELFCAVEEPKIVRCSRSDKCGYEEPVRQVLPELFEDWSKQAPATEENPNATADAYLQHERGLDLRALRSGYTQETYKDFNTGATSAAIRFPLPGGSHWERLIDRPGRFGKKAHFKKGGTWSGHCWMHPEDDFDALAQCDEIWIAEGIFDALALRQAFSNRDTMRGTASAMSCNTYPEHFLDSLRKAIADGKTPKQQPKLIFAFDVGAAGVTYTRKFCKRAAAEGWSIGAAQVRPDGEGSKLDWNDLWLRHRDWKGDAAKAPLAEDVIEEYLHNGEITIAESAFEKAKLILERAHIQARLLNSFDLRFDNRIYWAKRDDNEGLTVHEICNCAFRILYRERNELTDETAYFLQIDFPGRRNAEKARFSNGQIANNAEFKKRLLAFAGMWTGEQGQLDHIIKRQTRDLKKIEPIDFTGYSPSHKSWVFGDIAVRNGRVITINQDRYFDLGKAAVKRASPQNLLDISYTPDKINFSWMDDIWQGWGVHGLVALGFFCMSAFAVQVRKQHKSIGFLEITGEGGSGKTTLIEALWRSFGRFEHEGIDPNKGTMAYLPRQLMSVSNLPVGLIEGNRDEGRRNHSRQFDWAELLVLYNGRNPRGRAMKTSGNETYDPPFYGTIYLMQNEPISAMQPVLERIMSMRFNKTNHRPGGEAAAERIETMPMDQMSATLVHLVRQESDWLPFFFDRYDHHRDAMATRKTGLINRRIIKCHAQLAAAVEALTPAFNVSAERVGQTVDFIDTMAIDRQLTSGGDHPLIADFWDKVEYLIRMEADSRHQSGTSLNQHRKPDQLIAINLPQMDAALGQANMGRIDMEALKKILRNSKSRKFVDYKPVNNPVGKISQCWVFEQPSASDLVI